MNSKRGAPVILSSLKAAEHRMVVEALERPAVRWKCSITQDDVRIGRKMERALIAEAYRAGLRDVAAANERKLKC